ncbi:hypothetical protein Pmani_019903 [Petrolisthes manimaculis]|uniref:Uncharacterized protein n=1 Tax=Petrolisthes manimaculis TaxID=1843537 RepID=A0AAE1PIP7_9EUCA|nr:hypothetical protein Pmani_019903 [Petrolisthes manimaculis]
MNIISSIPHLTSSHLALHLLSPRPSPPLTSPFTSSHLALHLLSPRPSPPLTSPFTSSHLAPPFTPPPRSNVALPASNSRGLALEDHQQVKGRREGGREEGKRGIKALRNKPLRPQPYHIIL